MARYTTSVIANCVFGIKCDAINDPNHTFRVISKNMIDIDFKQGIIQAINAFLPGVSEKLILLVLR